MLLVLAQAQPQPSITLTIILSALGTLGAGGILLALVNFYLARVTKRGETRQQASAAQIQTAAETDNKFRGELWERLREQTERNDHLATQRGELIQEKAQLAGTVALQTAQITQLSQQLAVALQKADDAERRRQKEQERLESLRDSWNNEIDKREDLERQVQRLTAEKDDWRGRALAAEQRRRRSDAGGEPEVPTVAAPDTLLRRRRTDVAPDDGVEPHEGQP